MSGGVSLDQPRAHAADAEPGREHADQLVAQRAWIALLRGGADTAALEELTADQWNSLAAEAQRHQLSALTYRTLSTHPERYGAPDTVLARLRPAYREAALRNAVLFRQTGQAVKWLAERGIPVMLLKGIHLAPFVYAEPALRNMADVDLMVRREHLAETERVFLEHGYGPLPRPNIDEFCRWSNHLAKLTKPGAPVFEMHWHIERPTSSFHIDLEALWARSREAIFEGVAVRLLAPEDLLLHLILHESYHHRFDRSALKGLVDIDAVVVRHRDEIDWNALAQRAVDWGAAGFAYTTLRLTAEILGTPIPAQSLRALPRDHADEELVEVARRFILLPGQELPKVYLELAQSRNLRERLQLLVRNIFLPRRKMERVYGLGRDSAAVWAFYLFRLVTLPITRGTLSLRALFHTRAMRAPLDREEQRQRIAEWVKDLPGPMRDKWDPERRRDSPA